MTKKIISIVLCLCMVFSMLAFADPAVLEEKTETPVESTELTATPESTEAPAETEQPEETAAPEESPAPADEKEVKPVGKLADKDEVNFYKEAKVNEEDYKFVSKTVLPQPAEDEKDEAVKAKYAHYVVLTEEETAALAELKLTVDEQIIVKVETENEDGSKTESEELWYKLAADDFTAKLGEYLYVPAADFVIEEVKETETAEDSAKEVNYELTLTAGKYDFYGFYDTADKDHKTLTVEEGKTVTGNVVEEIVSDGEAWIKIAAEGALEGLGNCVYMLRTALSAPAAEEAPAAEPTILTTEAGNGLSVTANGVLPDGVTLVTDSVPLANLADEQAYINALYPVEEGLTREFYAIDIGLVKDGMAFEPAAGERLTITLSGLPLNATGIKVLHLVDTAAEANETPAPEATEAPRMKLFAKAPLMKAAAKAAAPVAKDNYVMESATIANGEATFTVGSFSTFLFTVDFEYEGKTFSITGMDSILLSELFKVLNINYDVSSATEVVFTDPELVSVEQQANGDWLLTSLKAFSSEEKLSIQFASGKTLEIKVTDANTGTLNFNGKTLVTGLENKKAWALLGKSKTQEFVTPWLIPTTGKTGLTSLKSYSYSSPTPPSEFNTYNYVLGEFTLSWEFEPNTAMGDGHYFIKAKRGPNADQYLKFNEQGNHVTLSDEKVDTLVYSDGTYTSLWQIDGEGLYYALNHDGGRTGVYNAYQNTDVGDSNNWFKLISDNTQAPDPTLLNGKTGALITSNGYAVTDTVTSEKLENDHDTAANKLYYSLNACDDDRLKDWTFTAVPQEEGGVGDGSDGKYYITNSEKKYLDFSASKKGWLSDDKVITYVAKYGTAGDLNLYQEVADEVNGTLQSFVLNQIDGANAANHFGGLLRQNQNDWFSNTNSRFKFITETKSESMAALNFWYPTSVNGAASFNCLTVNANDGRKLSTILSYMELDGEISAADVVSIDAGSGLKADNSSGEWMISPLLAMATKTGTNDYTTLTLNMSDGSTKTIYVTYNKTLPTKGDWPSKNIGNTNFFNVNNLFGAKSNSKFFFAMDGDVTVKGTINCYNNDSTTVIFPDTERVSGDVTFKLGANITMFNLENGKLDVRGTERSKVIFSGNTDLSAYIAGGSVPSGTYTSARFLNATSGATNRNVVTLENCEIRNFYGAAGASVIYGRSLTLNAKNCLFEDNVANNTALDAPIVFKGGTIVADFTDCIFNHNFGQPDYAGGVIKASVEANTNMTLESCTFTDNYSSGWGGAILWASNANNCKAVINNCEFIGNEAKYLGGALSNEGVMEISNTTFENNVAKSGGAIAAFPFTVGGSEQSGTNCGLNLLGGNIIQNNEATATQNFTAFGTSYPAGGGGIYFFMNKDGWKSTFELGEGNLVSGNVTGGSGGGVYLNKVNGTALSLTINGAEIIENTAAVNGGGVALIKANLDIVAGTIEENTAGGNGGGIYFQGDGPAKTTLNLSGAGNIRSNEAANGGGFYCDNGAMNMAGGYVMYNDAVGTPAETVSSAFDSAQNVGVGGGIYVAPSGTLSITSDTAKVGIYKNRADFAADDVYSSSSNTNIKIPTVEGMTIVDEKGRTLASGLDWTEDYANKDSKYESGIKKAPYTNGSEDIQRYRFAVDDEHKWTVGNTEFTSNYVCLTLGYRYVFVTVTKTVTGTETTDKFDFTCSYHSYETIEDESKSFKLAHGEKIEIAVPKDSTNFKLEEASSAYATSYSVDGGASVSGRVYELAKLEAETTIDYVNDLSLAPLTITKAGANETLDPNQSFIFTVKGVDDTNKDIEMQVVITGNGSVTIYDLPMGNYTVVEDENWSWRYTADETSYNVEVKPGGGEVTVTNTRDQKFWLDGNAVAVNKVEPTPPDQSN